MITGLSSEKDRWTIDLQNLHVEQTQIIGTTLVCASFLAYTGAFSFEFRHQMVYIDWLSHVQEQHIPISLPFEIQKVLSNDVEIST